MNGIDAGVWPEVAQKLGLGGAVVLILAIGVAVGLATRGPEWIKALGAGLDTILTHRRESRRIKEMLKREHEVLGAEFRQKGIERVRATGESTP